MRERNSMWSSFQMPRSCGVMRPSADTAQASVKTSDGAADGAAAEMDEVPVVGEAVGAGILAHGRDDDAVAEEDIANLQFIE